MKGFIKRNRNVLLFIAFLLLALFLRWDPEPWPFLVTLFYCGEYLVYAGLILSWRQSLEKRLLPTRAKGYLLTTTLLMLQFLAVQAAKYRIAVSPAAERTCWYLYYVPIILVPTFFCMTCLRLGKGEERTEGRFRADERLLLFPALLLVAGILTNDLHCLAFLPNGDIRLLSGYPGTYTHGFLYYAVCGWAGCAMAAGVVFLIVSCRRSGGGKKAYLPLVMLLLMPVLIVLTDWLREVFEEIMFEFPQMFIFGLIGVFEACIRVRLIPSNVNYPGFFAQTDLPVLITDRELLPVFQTRSPVRADGVQLREALKGPIRPEPDVRLSGMPIRAGYAFWTGDESAVNRLNEELRDANELLAMENEILEREQLLAAEQAGIEERSRLYRKASRETYSAQKKIAEILRKAEPGRPSFRPDIARALVLTAYVKRKANFVLVEAERPAVSVKELASAMEESAHFLRYCGIHTVVDVGEGEELSCRSAMAVYDCFEAAAEGMLGKTAEMFVRLRDRELLVMADGRDLPELSGLPLPLRSSAADGQLVFRFDLGREAV